MFESMINPLTKSEEIDKAIRLVEYMARLATLRTKVVRNISEYQSVLWINDIPKQPGCFARVWGCDEEMDPDVWVEVQNKREPQLPTVPDLCKDWVNKGVLRNKNDLPELLPMITRKIENPDWNDDSDQPEFIDKDDRLEDHPEIQADWDRYVEDMWYPWLESHNSWETVHKVYSNLFAIYQEQMRLGEEYELILGMGLLTWQVPTGQAVRRHVIVADAILEFEAKRSKFILRAHTEGTKLRPELDMLDIADQPAHAEETAKVALNDANDDPWERGCVEGLLQALVHSISSDGEYDYALESKNLKNSAKPVIEYSPGLILRKRSSKGLTEILKKIKGKIEAGEVIPHEFSDLAEIECRHEMDSGDHFSHDNIAPHGEVFFPKPSNTQQRAIVEKIRSSSGVVVQGPPGTGKSHTIANLICHLLATGQRTLITAKTPRALQVLERLIPDELRPLCINLLGSGLEEKRSLESSVNGILRKNGEWNEEDSIRAIEVLEGDLCRLREEKAIIDRRLRDIRESETHSQSIANGTYRGTVARIAEAVNRNRDKYEWFVDTVSMGVNCPITERYLSSIIRGLRLFTSEKREELKRVWPDVLPSHEEIANLFETETRVSEEENCAFIGADKRVAELLINKSFEIIEMIRDAFITFQGEQKKIMNSPFPWMSDAIKDAMGGNTSFWRELFLITKKPIDVLDALVSIADDIDIDYPDDVNIKMLYEDACILKEHIGSGGKLKGLLLYPKPVKERKYIIKKIRINGRLCSGYDDFSLLADGVRVRIEMEKVWGVWKGRVEKVQGPFSLQLHTLKAMCEAIEKALSLEELIGNCRETLKEIPVIGEPIWSDGPRIDELIAACQLALARQRLRLISDEIKIIENSFSALAENNNVHPATNDLIQTIRGRIPENYKKAAGKIEGLKKDRQLLQDVDEHVSKMFSLLPELTKNLKQTFMDPNWDERPVQMQNAWCWAQARYWIEEHIKKDDVPALVSRSKQIEDEINAIIAKLASVHAWSYCFSRLHGNHRRHMVAWQQSMARLGKGTGKHAPLHRRDAQRHLNECREAVPAWVMPLHRVWDTVDPMPGMFDVIIVDEASQCGIEALPLFYLGKKILIVGDDKQISPDAVGVKQDAVHRLMDELLYDFRYKSSFNIESSLFDHGKLRHGTRQIILREHFRCMPEIIRFSNDLCYSDTPLIPLRQYGPDRLSPLESVFVRGGYREGLNNRVINRPEALAIVEKIAELCADEQYSGKTMGVVVLQGEAQSGLIEGQLLERLGAEEMERRRIICGNPYTFQGDERDVIFLSLVAANNELIGSLTKASYERRFNVAASRARDQMFLFHSVTCEDLGMSCLRRRLLEFFQGTKPKEIAGIDKESLERKALNENRSIVKAPMPFDSWFEVDVALEILRKGFDIIPQYEIGGYRIDLVIEGGDIRLAVECDGDHWHGLDRYEEDMHRQRQLERCGWEFFRIRESAYYSNRERALERLWEVLEEIGVCPVEPQSFDDSELDDEDNDYGLDDDEADAEYGGQDDDMSENDYRDFGSFSSRRTDEVSMQEIKDTILNVLSKCPNQTSTLDSMTARVLKELRILTRGNPRKEFEKKLLRCIGVLERDENIEQYKSKNKRLRLMKGH